MREFAGKFVLVLFYLTAFYLECQAIECFSCQNIGDVHNCNVTVHCNSGESCSMTEAVQGTKRFNVGCLENQKCGSSGPAVVPVGKRQTTNCHECCSSDLCNKGLCSHLKPSACVDDERQDCAQLHSLLNICNDIQHAKLICPKFCNLCSLVDGIWAQWSNWTSCDVTCGQGTQMRSRTCTDPAPAHGGADCTGQSTENMQCTKDLCPVHGGWSKWNGWASCSVTCDLGLQRRDRSCSNPYPSRFGNNCYGDSRDDQICLQPPCANGGWAGWGSWSACSLTCGGGVQSRSRTCSDPTPSILGHYCNGDAQQTETCSSKRCPPVVSAFSVDHPYNYSRFNGSDKLTFYNTIYQHGGGFDPSTGTFTCSIPGTYHFLVTLVKKRKNTRVDNVQCYINKSGSNIIRIFIDPTDDDTDNGSAAISQFVVLHLNKGDTVFLTSCTSPPSTFMESWSSFTGFLLYADS